MNENRIFYEVLGYYSDGSCDYTTWNKLKYAEDIKAAYLKLNRYEKVEIKVWEAKLTEVR